MGRETKRFLPKHVISHILNFRGTPSQHPNMAMLIHKISITPLQAPHDTKQLSTWDK